MIRRIVPSKYDRGRRHLDLVLVLFGLRLLDRNLAADGERANGQVLCGGDGSRNLLGERPKSNRGRQSGIG